MTFFSAPVSHEASLGRFGQQFQHGESGRSAGMPSSRNKPLPTVKTRRSVYSENETRERPPHDGRQWNGDHEIGGNTCTDARGNQYVR